MKPDEFLLNFAQSAQVGANWGVTLALAAIAVGIVASLVWSALGMKGGE